MDMADPSRRRRLSEIARGRGAAPGRPRPKTARTARSRSATLEELVPGEEIVTGRGRHWRHQRLIKDPPDVETAARILRPGSLPEVEAREVACLDSAGLDGALFLDLETCGFSGTPLFLTGALRVRGSQVELIQLVARDYAEEASVVAASLELLHEHPLLVTFNGKSYDLPFLRERAVRHGLEPVEPAGHLDLLHAARRRWRDVLPDCRLQTLEARFTGRHRAADVPGSEVPERYHSFVRGGPASELVPVLRHNLLDLLTLLTLLGRITLDLSGEGR
jgi:uncharacterized protein YprB with RNaseH-like and TPR domain